MKINTNGQIALSQAELRKAFANVQPGADAHWSVTVTRNRETLVTIASNSLSGKADFTPEEVETIRSAAQHLQAFIGAPPQEPT